MRWYSNKSWLWIVVRGLLVAALGAVAATALDLHRVSWVVVIGVPALLTLVNLRAWYQDKQRR
jgi:hypothetical protein